MLVENIYQAVLISIHCKQTPNLVLLPHLTGSGCKVLFRFPSLPTNYDFSFSQNNLEQERILLENFDELNRLCVAAQGAYRERGER
jgi:hypothetical protein